MFESQFQKDNWHREAKTIAVRNAIRTRRWGMRVTVYDDPTPANNGEYVLSPGLSNQNRQDNANWLKVADPGQTWGGGGGADPHNEYFTGDGAETVFTISDATGVIQLVEQGGQVLRPGTDYTIAGPEVTFPAAPGNGIDIGIYYFTPGGGSGGSVQSVTGDVNNTDPANPVTRLIGEVIDTTGSNLAFDFQSRSQMLFVGSAAMSTPKTWDQPINDTHGLAFDFHFEITDVAAVQIVPSNFVMVANPSWNSANKEWTPPATGLYEGGATFDGTTWKLKINGPFV